MWAQNMSLGVKVGVPMTDFFNTGSSSSLHGTADYWSDTRRYTFGLSGEAGLKHGVGFEVDALYHRMGFQANINTFDTATGKFSRAHVDVVGNTWDFPFMLKYRAGHKPIRPYVAGGFVLRWVASALETGSVVAGDPFSSTNFKLGTNDVTDLRKSLYPGVTIVGGVDVPMGKIHVSPEIRYTRWTANIAQEGGLIRFEPNQAEFMLGLSF
jgi:hypothetical protein